MKMRFYAAQSDPLKFAEALMGSNEYRFRVGDYRVIFEVLHDIIWVIVIKRRDEAYRYFRPLVCTQNFHCCSLQFRRRAPSAPGLYESQFRPACTASAVDWRRRIGIPSSS